ncbi:MAG: hypothetical protein WKF57_01390 [Nakamurella sp.]
MPITQLPTADLGTPDQRRRAKAGCQSGIWAEWGALPDGSGGMVSMIGDVDLARFAVFAIRMGVDGRRAGAVTDFAPIPDVVLHSVSVERGPTFCSRFIERVNSATPRWHGRKTKVCVELIAELDLPVPDDLTYLQEWSDAAHSVLTGMNPWEWSGLTPPALPSAEAVTARFAEHVRAAVAADAQLTGSLLPTVQEGLARGLIERDELVGLSFIGLDRARRPSERAAWVTFLLSNLAVTDAEIVERAEQLIPALATGAPETIDNLGLVLLAQAPEHLLPDLAVTMLSAASSRRLRTSIVDTLAARSRPETAVVQEISGVLAAFEAKAIVPKSLAALTTAWAMDGVDPAPPPEVHAAWRPTPPVWPVPGFDAGPATLDHLIESVRVLIAGPQEVQVFTTEAERVLALVISCAAADSEATRAVLRGARRSWVPGLGWLGTWLEGGRFEAGWSQIALSGHREMSVMERAGEIPCLLSEPSWDDLRVDAADLAGRLDRYAAAGLDVCETDLLLALTRTDPATVTAELDAALRRSQVGVVLPHRIRSKRSTGQWIGLWFDEPVTEPELVNHGGRFAWRAAGPDIPQPLHGGFSRFVDGGHSGFDFWEFPTWGDAAMSIVNTGRGGAAGEGMVLRQLVRRGRTLPPGAAVNLLAAQRDPHPAASAEIQQAVLDAFDRGILRPGSIDVRYLDWSDRPRSIAAFGRALRELAEIGLLSVVWQVADDLIEVAASAPTVAAGTEVLVDAIAALLPAVRSAVEAGIADASVLELPGTRVLAARTGSGIAVKTARTVVSSLRVTTEAAAVAALDLPPFEEIWPEGVGTAPAIDDRSQFTIRKIEEYWRGKGLEVCVQYPQFPGRSFGLSADNGPNLVRTGRAAGLEEWSDFKEVAFHWDPEARRIARSKARALSHPEQLAPITRDGHPPLSTSLVAVVLAGIHDGDTHFAAELVRRNQFGAAAVTQVLTALLGSPDVDPARLVHILTAVPQTLPALWPLVTESVRLAGDVQGPLPRWVNGVLTVAVWAAPYLSEAVRRGLAPERAAQWQGLEQIAARPGKSAAVLKARELLELLGPSS